MIRVLLLISFVAGTSFAFAADQPAVRIEPTNLHGPRPLEKQTEAAAISGYLQAWQTLRLALEQNRVDLLDTDFVGTAKDKLTDTIQEQAKLGIRTRYLDHSHDLQVVFYSPEGLSIQLVDNVEYQVELLDQDKTQTTQTVRARCIAILTPSEVRWRVRVFQAESQ